MAELALDRKAVIASLTKSPHGDLSAYKAESYAAMALDPEFFAHLIAWNHRKGQVRDAKVALPTLCVASLVGAHPLQGTRDAMHQMPDASRAVLIENALAHLADLPPFMFVKAMEFAREMGASSRLFRRLNERYLRELESDRHNWERVALRDRSVLRTLYGRYHVKPGAQADTALMKGQATVGKFAAVKSLKNLSAADVAVAIRKHKLPFKITRALLGERAKEVDIAMAIIQTLSPSDLVSHMKALKCMGVQNEPVLRAALEQAILGAGKPKKANRVTLKTTRAAEAMEEAGDVVLASKLRALQEVQIDNLGGVDGDWLILGDASGSMAHAVELARQVAGIMGRMVKGSVYLVFFDSQPRAYQVTGKSYEEIKALTQLLRAGGSTSIGCGLQYAVEASWDVDGIAIISDGGQNHVPNFRTAYAAFEKKFDRKPTVYFYKVPGSDRDTFTMECQAADIDVQVFDLCKGGTHATVDMYSLPNIVQTMRTRRYSLSDEIMNMPLVTLDEAMPKTKGMDVLARSLATA